MTCLVFTLSKPLFKYILTSFTNSLPCFLNVHFSNVYYQSSECGLHMSTKPPSMDLKIIPRKVCVGKS